MQETRTPSQAHPRAGRSSGCSCTYLSNRCVRVELMALSTVAMASTMDVATNGSPFRLTSGTRRQEVVGYQQTHTQGRERRPDATAQTPLQRRFLFSLQPLHFFITNSTRSCFQTARKMSVSQSVKSLSHIRLFATPWTVAHQASPSMGFSRQEYRSGLPFPSPGDLPDPGIEPGSPTLEADALTSEPPGKHTSV